MFQSIVSAVVATGVLWLATAPVHAQTSQRPERPYRGLFGGDAAAGSGHSLSLNASIGGGYDDNLLLTQPGGGGGGGSNVTQPVAGTLATARASLGYNANLGRFSLGANAGSFTSYYPSQNQTFLTGHGAGVAISTPLARRTTLGLSASAAYMPFTFASVFPVADGLDVASFGQAEPLPLVFATNDGEFLSYSSALQMGHTFSPRLTGSASYLYAGRSATLYNRPFYRHGGGGGVQYGLGQGLSLNLGYRRMEGAYGGLNGDASQDSINAGINYNRALSFSRRTSLGFGTGSTIVRSSNNSRFRMTGNANLNHEVGRTWLASVGYARGVGFVETLLEPVFQDSVNAGFGGLLHRRVQVQSSFRASIGNVGFGVNSGYDTAVASVGSSVAISQHLNFGVNYSIFRYSFEDGVVLPVGVPSAIHRQSVRATISVWAPLLNTARRTNAAR